MIYEKRGKWCFRDAKGKLHKYTSKHEAEAVYYNKTDTMKEEEALREEVTTPSFTVEMPTLEEPAVTENGQDWFDENEE